MNFEVEEVRRVQINRFGIIETLYNINYDKLMMSFEEADALIKEMLKEFVRAFTARMLENDMIAVVFDRDDFNFSITIPFMKKKDYSSKKRFLELLNHINIRYYLVIEIYVPMFKYKKFQWVQEVEPCNLMKRKSIYPKK
jgi:hypothetical protein